MEITLPKKRKTEAITHVFCEHAQEEVELTTQIVFPVDIMPDQPPRITSRHCSHFFDCNLQDKSVCTLTLQSLKPKVPD
jgi:hypothetical protein